MMGNDNQMALPSAMVMAAKNSRPASPSRSRSGRAGGVEARAAEKRRNAVRRQELLSGLSPEETRDVTSFMGSVNTKARNTLQEVARLVASSGRDSRLLVKRVLVHALAHLGLDRCVSFLEMMMRLGQDATLQLLWLYERYSVPNAGRGGMTKCQADHFGRDAGVGRIDEILAMPEDDQGDLARQLAEWHPGKKTKVFRAWEATDPAFSSAFLMQLIREEQGRGDGAGNLWQCSLCPVKRGVEIEARMRRGEHRRKDRTVDAGSLYVYCSGTRGGTVLFRSPHESLFEFRHVKRASNQVSGNDHDELPRLTYARRSFDVRRLCRVCTEELRGAVVTGGHDIEIWHAVDHERRALHTDQRERDLFKARWAERERGDRQVSELLQFICEANMAAFSRHTLTARATAAHNAQAAEIRRILDLRLSDQVAVKEGSRNDEILKQLNVREAEESSRRLRLKASLNMDRHYASLEPGGVPASLKRRHAKSSKPADYLDDGTPATPQAAMQTFGRAEPPDDDESAGIRDWKEGAEDAEQRLDRRREVRQWQSIHGRRARFSYLCGRWVGAASDIEERQWQQRMIEAAEREKRARERQAAKLKRKEQLANLRARASSRATGDERRREERDREEEARRKRERDELLRMRLEESAQLANGDRYWGLVVEMKRLRAIEEERRLLWEARIKAAREKMVAVRCISEESTFSHATPPRDPELARKIAWLAAM